MKDFIIRKRMLIISLLLALFSLQSLASITTKSATFDEVQYFGIGKYLLLNQKWYVMGAIMHPPLSYYISSIPLLFFAEDKRLWEYEETNRDLKFLGAVDAYRGQELLSDPHNANDRLLISSRLMILMVGLLLGFYIYRFSSELYGVQGGIISLFLFAFCPNMLAFSGIAVPDMPFTAFSFIAIYYFRSFLKAPSYKSSLIAGITLGVALSTKFTALLLIPVELTLYAVFLVKEKKRFNCQIFILIGGALFILLLSYGFNYTPYIQGNEYRLIQLEAGFKTFFHGNHSLTGWWYYYPVVFLLKTPIPVMVLLIAAIGYFLKCRKDEWFDALLLSLPIVVIFTVFASSKIAAGVRYLLPMYPFIFVIIGGLSLYGKRVRYLLYIMAVWYVAASLFIAPHYLAYFNEIIGGSGNAYKYLVDSNLDWGQDLKGLKKYMDKHSVKKISLSYFGLDSPSRYGIDYDWLPSHHLYNPDPEKTPIMPQNQLVAISVTNLQGVYLDHQDEYKWFRQYEPAVKIGYSIFIYDLNNLKKVQ